MNEAHEDTVSNFTRILETTLPKQLANEHWEWVVKWLEMVYKDAFIHGYKHGYEESKYERSTE